MCTLCPPNSTQDQCQVKLRPQQGSQAQAPQQQLLSCSPSLVGWTNKLPGKLQLTATFKVSHRQGIWLCEPEEPWRSFGFWQHQGCSSPDSWRAISQWRRQLISGIYQMGIISSMMKAFWERYPRHTLLLCVTMDEILNLKIHTLPTHFYVLSKSFVLSCNRHLLCPLGMRLFLMWSKNTSISWWLVQTHLLLHWEP